MIRELVLSLGICLDELQERLFLLEPIQAHMARIPPVLSGCENNEITHIEPEPVDDVQVPSALGEAFKDLTIQKPYSQKAARRYVGMAQYSVSKKSEEVNALIVRINQLKNEIQQKVITEYKTRGDRFRVMHEAYPGGMTIHIYRQIHLLNNEDVASLRFTWQKKEVVTQPNKKQLLEQMGALYAATDTAEQIPLLQLMDAVNKTAEVRLRIRRPVKVQPAANVVSTEKKFTLNAPLPIIVIQDQHIATASISNFDTNTIRKARSDRNNNQLLGTFNGFQIEALA